MQSEDLALGEKPCSQCQLCNCDQREAVAEIPVPCLVVKDEHAQRTADTAAQQRPEEQPLFRNAHARRMERRLSMPMAQNAITHMRSR